MGTRLKIKIGDKILITGCEIGGCSEGCIGAIKEVIEIKTIRLRSYAYNQLKFHHQHGSNEDTCFVSEETEYTRI